MRQGLSVCVALAMALAAACHKVNAAPASSGASVAPGLAVGPVASARESAVRESVAGESAVRASASQLLARRVIESADHRQLPFAIVDKQAALITVYNADGSVAGVSTALLGRTPGDQASPGVGDRAQNGTLKLEDLTTPAGRFASVPGRNRAGDSVVWLDYANALAIHRLRPAPASQQREQRMASADPRDKRISAGCVVVPVAFFDKVVQPVLGRGQAVVYVIPEVSGQWASLLPATATAQASVAMPVQAQIQMPIQVPVQTPVQMPAQMPIQAPALSSSL